MIALWMLYSLLLSALLGVAAWAGERLLHLHRRPTRWVWGAALLLSVLLPPALALSGPVALPEGAAVVEWRVEAILPPEAAPSLSAPAAPRFALSEWLDSLLLTLWLGGSLLVAGTMVLSFLAVRRGRRRWREEVVGGEAVYLSEVEGPAVVGLFRPRIVLPRWVLEWEDALQRLIIEHEREHIRARDPLLLLATLGVLLLLPWNVALWWQARRLRLAVEMDCDGRVLRRRPDVRRYGNLLLEVGRLRSRAPLAAMALTEPLSFLERRIDMITAPRPQRRLRLALVPALVLLAAPLAAAVVPLPERPELGRGGEIPAPAAAPIESETIAPAPPPALPGEEAATATEAAIPQAGEEMAPLAAGSAPRVETAADTLPPVARRPTFTPYDRAPEMRHRAEFQRALMQAYPPVPRDAGIGGSVRLWVYIDEEGVVRNTRVAQSSGHPALDEAAETVMRQAQFHPAQLQEQPVGVWVQFPVTFQVADAEPPAQRLRVRGQVAPPKTVRGAAPFFTPYEQAPELLNREAFQRGLMQAYPPALRDAGIGGTVRLWVYIDEEGVVGDTRVAESSGYPALDEAAQAVMHEARFRPARNRGQAVPVWVQMPVTFQVDAPREERAVGGSPAG